MGSEELSSEKMDSQESGSANSTGSDGWELHTSLLTWQLSHTGTFTLRPAAPTAPQADASGRVAAVPAWLHGTAAITTRSPESASPDRPLHLARIIPSSVRLPLQENSPDDLGPASHLEAQAALLLPGSASASPSDTPAPSHATLHLHATLYEQLPLLRLHLGISNTSTAPLILEHLLPVLVDEAVLVEQETAALTISGKARGWSCYQHGWQSWSYAGSIRPKAAGIAPRDPTLRAMHQPFPSAAGSLLKHPVFQGWHRPIISEALTLVGFPQHPPALLIGFLRARDQAGQIVLDRKNGRLAALAHAESHPLAPGATLWTEPLVLGFGEEQALLQAYAALVAQENHARTRQPTPTGWCSWYYYFTRVTEQDILDNVRALSTHKEQAPVQVIQIDDGYQTAVGDWTSIANTFPGGMRRLAEHIREQGFQPGIWLAPFTATTTSQLAQQHPDWLLRNAQGRPAFGGTNWNTTLYGLDCTHPQVQDWLRRLFETIVQDWGYNYLKLDFLYCAALPAIRHNPLATGVQALRSGLERIRNSVGDDIFLLGCGCPLLPAVGLVDAMRIGPDVAPAWLPHPHHMPGPRRQSFAQPSAFNAIRNSITRAWMHPSFWINDPDCLLLRREASDLSAAEIRTLASVIGLTGGMLLLSDPMQALPERAWEIAASLLPPFTQAAQPRSWLGAAPPGLITLPITRPWGNMLLAGLFNWASKPQHRRVQLAALGLAPGRYHISEFWTGNYRGIISESFSQHLPAHGAAVLLIQPATEQPALLSTTWHLTQGARELTHFAFDRDQLRLEWEIALDRTTTGTMRLYLPPPLRPGTLTSSAPQAVLRPGERAGEYLIHTTIPRQATFSLQLNQPTT